MEIIFVIFSILSLKEPHIKNFLIKSNQNGQVKYQLVKSIKCLTGPSGNSYVLAPTGKVLFKQISIDGEVGDVCKKH